jgi:hypothetical protein
MNDKELFEFDRQGYIVIKDILTSAQVASLSAAIDALELHALEHVDQPPRKTSSWNANYHASPRGYHAKGSNEEGETLIIEDFWNADPVFDVLVNHERTMGYVHGIVKERPTINNSEIRIRYKGNQSNMHGGGPTSGKYRYIYGENGIECMMVRMVYFVHDVNNEQGAFCVVPGTHKSNIAPPYGGDPVEDPGNVGLEVKAGDAIFFTEHLRHGGFINQTDQVRKTLHVGYGPHWLISQNISTMDEAQHITEETAARYDEEQNGLFMAAVIRK